MFDGSGKFETQWTNLHRPAWICQRPEKNRLFYIAELKPLRNWPNLGPRISIVTSEGNLVSRVNTTKAGPGLVPAPFAVPHAIAVDSRSDIYVADLAQHNWSKSFPNVPEAGFETLKKLVLVSPPAAG